MIHVDHLDHPDVYFWDEHHAVIGITIIFRIEENFISQW